MPIVAWFFEEEEIHEGDIYKMECTPDGTHSLFIPEAFPEDAGEYTVQATNEHGEVESTALLIVTGECMRSPYRLLHTKHLK